MRTQGLVAAGLVVLGGLFGVRAQGQAGGAASENAWLERSTAEDPANLKGERVRAVEEPDGLAERGRAAELEQSLRRLRTRASLMMIVAHPDDEDGGMLTYCSRGLGARVGMLTLTRGEGGQNVMTGDFNDALGLVRTRELLAADRVMGVDQMFGTEVDFGFSKTKEEAFAQWGYQRVLYDAVRAVRLYRPLVITAVFVGAPSDGHGQHQVSGEIAQEVFKAAADPKVFPEMGLPVWAPKAVFARVPFAQIDGKGMFDYATGKYVPVRFENYVTGKVSTVAPKADVMVPEGDTDAMLGGLSYVQWARRGLALQRTQIGGGMRTAPAGRVDVGYTRYGGRTGDARRAENGFFDGVDVSLAGMAELAPSEAGYLQGAMTGVDGAVGLAEAAAKSGGPEAAAPGLRDGLVAVRGVIAHVEAARMPEVERYDVLHELRVKEAQFEEALGFALGVTIRAEVLTDGAAEGTLAPLGQRRSEVPPQAAVRMQELNVEVEMSNESEVLLRVEDVTGRYARGFGVAHGDMSFTGKDSLIPKGVHDELIFATAAKDAPLTRPYFTRKGLEQPFYEVQETALRNAPVSPPALTAWETVRYGDVPIRFGAVVVIPPRAAGEIAQPLQVVPPVSVAAEPRVAVVRPTGERVPVHVVIRSDQRGAASGSVRLKVPDDMPAEPNEDRYVVPSGTSQSIAFSVQLTKQGGATRDAIALADFDGKEYREGYTRVGYPGIVRDNLYEPATVRVQPVDVRVAPGLRVAYLPGTGDATVAALENLGVRATTVSVAEIEAGALAKYDVLVMGVRAYAAQRALAAATPKLLEWVKAGGVEVLEYNTAEFGASDAPYPLELGGAAEKVVDETDRVSLLTPAAQVLAWPNRISERDFDGWIEERGHGFMTSWDQRYQAPTEVRDPGQDAQRGGLLVAPYGKGVYVYCAYALYRQWPEGVPGSYRLLANMVSLGRRP